MNKAIILINDTTYAFNLRDALIEKLISEHFQVKIVGQLLKHQDELKRMGASLVGVETERHGKNPLSDFRLFNEYLKILSREKPDIVLTYNIKPNVYGGIACQILGIPYFPNITGLGTPVENPGPLQTLTTKLYKLGVRKSSCIFFQNEDNYEFFKERNLISPSARTRIIPGSGVNTKRYPLLPWPDDKKIHFLYAARIMKEKGIDLYLAVARKFVSENVVFDVCGRCDDDKYRSILNNEEAVIYHGEQSDLAPFYEKCSCFLYPSYYPEGMSNVLLEAAASGRPIIATDRAGCRETLDDNVTGFLVPVNDLDSLINATGKFLKMSSDQRKKMGLLGRMKINTQFNRNIVVEAYLEEIARALKPK